MPTFERIKTSQTNALKNIITDTIPLLPKLLATQNTIHVGSSIPFLPSMLP